MLTPDKAPCISQNTASAATWTSVIVFLPLIFNKPSEMNIFLKELGLTVCLTLVASLLGVVSCIAPAISVARMSVTQGLKTLD